MKSRLTALLILFAASVFAQDMPKVVPPSPEAAAAFKFTEVPVSLYSGLPNITIPLFEIESGGVTVPISISYHARGIKVAEIASRVGLGWTLNAGGMVSRQERGGDDNAYSQLDLENFFYDEYVRFSEAHELWQFAGQPESQFNRIPDQYLYSVNGLSGKFIMDYMDNKILVQNYSDVKVESVNTIIDGKGNTYFFGPGDVDVVSFNRELKEIGTNYNQTGGAQVTENTWHLSSIKTYKGNLITFNYENEVSIFVRRSYDKYDPFSAPAQYRSNASEISSTQKRLTSIVFDKGRLVFEYNSQPREDFGNAIATNNAAARYLKRIVLYNNNNNIIKIVKFGYEYVLADDDNNTHLNYKTWDPPARKRLYLKTLHIEDNASVDIPPYRFEYNSIKLPNRHSNSQDVWGYYNGKANGRVLKSGPEAAPGARSVDTLYSAAGMLEKIVYPEGGSTKFYYEHNKVFNRFPRDVVFDNPNPYTTEYVYLSHIDYNNPAYYSVVENVYRKPFTVPEAKAGAVQYRVDISDPANCYPTSNFIHCKFQITIYNNNYSQVLYQTGDNQSTNLWNLKPGDYILEVKPRNPSHNPQIQGTDEYFSVDLKWIQTLPSTDPIYGAGKRIKKIEYYDPVNNKTITKTYDYNDPATGQTSGLLLGLPNFLSIERTIVTIQGEQQNVFGWIGNIPGSPLSTYQEQSVGYETVTEYTGEGSNVLGKTVRKFTITPDSGRYYDFPYHPPNDKEYLRGKELRVLHYKRNSDGSYSLVKKIENEYRYGGEAGPLVSIDYTHPLAIGLEDCPSPGTPGGIPLYCLNTDYVKNRKHYRLPLALIYYTRYENPDAGAEEKSYEAYQLTGGTMDLSKTITTDYFDDGSQIQTVNEYFYDHDHHYNLAEQHQTTSVGTEKIITKYYYSADPEMAGKPAVPDLLTMNMREIPLVTQTYKDGTKLSETETAFKDWDIGTGRLVMPEYIKTAKGDNTLENKIQFTKLDSENGNILEVRQVDGNYISYIWGFDGLYPIAKIENATLQQVLTALNMTEAAVKALTIIPVNTDIRTLLPNALVTTYEYTPLVGVTKITDPNGKNTYYEYDQLKRLKAVRDHYNNLLSETQYNYRPSTP